MSPLSNSDEVLYVTCTTADAVRNSHCSHRTIFVGLQSGA